MKRNKQKKNKIMIMSRFFGVQEQQIKRIIKVNKINVNKFYTLLDTVVLDKAGLIDKRNKFYKFFKNEDMADKYWIRCWE